MSLNCIGENIECHTDIVRREIKKTYSLFHFTEIVQDQNCDNGNSDKCASGFSCDAGQSPNLCSELAFLFVCFVLFCFVFREGEGG